MSDETKRAMVLLLLSRESKELVVSDEAMLCINNDLDRYEILKRDDPARGITVFKLIDVNQKEGIDFKC
ncbi:hypothetical protein [Bacillus cereus]